jgi:hypothetical protein
MLGFFNGVNLYFIKSLKKGGGSSIGRRIGWGVFTPLDSTKER